MIATFLFELGFLGGRRHLGAQPISAVITFA